MSLFDGRAPYGTAVGTPAARTPSAHGRPRVWPEELARVEARGVQSGATTGDERLANAAYAVLQRFRGGQLTLTEALRLAQSVAGRWMAPVSASFVPRLFLAASPGSWLGLRQETASLVLDFFSPQQAAKEAIKVMQKYLERHEQFQRFDQNSGPPRSSPEGRRAAAQTREGSPKPPYQTGRPGSPGTRPAWPPFAHVGLVSSELMARTVRRADRAWVALAAVTAARESCEVSQWLQEEAVDQGYHVLCISEQDEFLGKALGRRSSPSRPCRPDSTRREEPIQLYVEGLQSQMLQLQGGKLVERLEEKLHIRRHLEFLEEGQSTVTQWPKQSWAVFTSEGERWRPEELDELVEGALDRKTFGEGVLTFIDLTLLETWTWTWQMERLCGLEG
eukprot:g24885.t1